jgi:hypothetical protein
MGVRDNTTHGCGLPWRRRRSNATGILVGRPQLHTTTTVADKYPMMLVPMLACCTWFGVICRSGGMV